MSVQKHCQRFWSCVIRCFHILRICHRIDFDRGQILLCESNSFKRKIIKSFYNKSTPRFDGNVCRDLIVFWLITPEHFSPDLLFLHWIHMLIQSCYAKWGLWFEFLIPWGSFWIPVYIFKRLFVLSCFGVLSVAWWWPEMAKILRNVEIDKEKVIYRRAVKLVCIFLSHFLYSATPFSIYQIICPRNLDIFIKCSISRKCSYKHDIWARMMLTFLKIAYSSNTSFRFKRVHFLTIRVLLLFAWTFPIWKIPDYT